MELVLQVRAIVFLFFFSCVETASHEFITMTTTVTVTVTPAPTNCPSLGTLQFIISCNYHRML